MDKVVNQACLRNQAPIFEALNPWLSTPGQLLELGSGTGQHGVFIAKSLPHIQWQLSEHPDNLELSHAWYQEAALQNVLPAIPIDILQSEWPIFADHFEYGYCSNILHFISEKGVISLFSGMARALKDKGALFCYGPINENGFTSEGNLTLDTWVKQDINAAAGIKELSYIQDQAQQQNFIFKQRVNLPANNVLLVFELNKT